jgi:hypothetical protein
MIEKLASIVSALIAPGTEENPGLVFCPADDNIPRALNSGFLVTLAGPGHPKFQTAERFIESLSASSEWGETARFYREGRKLIHQEIEARSLKDARFAERLKSLAEWVLDRQNMAHTRNAAEKFWSVFFPEACGILGNEEQSVRALRLKRKVTVTELNPAPIADPAGEILFTSNVLLTGSDPPKSLENLPWSDKLKDKLARAIQEPQLYWYDHPIEVGVGQEQNEILYGLRNLDAAFEFEKNRGNIPPRTRPVCVLSVSVTHRGLQGLAKSYLETELGRSGELNNLNIYAFTEFDTKRIISEILAPAASRYLNRKDAPERLAVLGVDGEYGRHYSFLKAIAAFWNVFVDIRIKATFKIDLDQVFPQRELVAETGASAFEHLRTPLWGACGLDSNGEPLELGLIAGALVNEKDIVHSVFTPDVRFPEANFSWDEFFFFSRLPQALSTEAEMMERYGRGGSDGRTSCSQRIHVTGGTNGILVDSLRRHRPFTPSFIGRAEDQAYILSVRMNPGAKLAYVHKDGLIMRHDKETCAGQAMESAWVGKLVGDYVRILHFSAYAAALTDDVAGLKDIIDPFTGCFVSFIPATVVHLRFAFKAASLFGKGDDVRAGQFIRNGAVRIGKALDFVRGQKSQLRLAYERERLDWDLFYDTLSAVEGAIRNKDDFALKLQARARVVIARCAIKPERRRQC